MQSDGFGAVACMDAKVLILGSLPGITSLERGEYYAQPRNAFWPIMGKLVGALPELPYAERLACLTGNGIALWDVCASGYRPGSLDSAIDMPTVVTNDFILFFSTYSGIRNLYFNGSKAKDIYCRKVLAGLPPAVRNIPHEVLPSTSPAHASLSLEQKLVRWRSVVTPSS